jgi:hypothetical protein
MYNETRGTVVELKGEDATVELEDGSRRIVRVPELIDVEIGTAIRIVDVGAGEPIYLWGR